MFSINIILQFIEPLECHLMMPENQIMNYNVGTVYGVVLKEIENTPNSKLVTRFGIWLKQPKKY